MEMYKRFPRVIVRRLAGNEGFTQAIPPPQPGARRTSIFSPR